MAKALIHRLWGVYQEKQGVSQVTYILSQTDNYLVAFMYGLLNAQN